MTRVRGLADWRPRPSTEERMKDVEAVFEEYADHRPLTIRQVLYRLVAVESEKLCRRPGRVTGREA